MLTIRTIASDGKINVDYRAENPSMPALTAPPLKSKKPILIDGVQHYVLKNGNTQPVESYMAIWHPKKTAIKPVRFKKKIDQTQVLDKS